MQTTTSPSNSVDTQSQDTPMMRQYKAIKKDHEDAILLFRLGDFYEMFLDDAVIASRELSLTLTGRGKNENRISMCGMPFHSADSYIEKLVKKGYKVAICEQTEDAAVSQGLTKREVVRVITPGTVLSNGSLEDSETNYLAAVYTEPYSKKASENRFGLACVDSSTGRFVVYSASSVEELQHCLEQLEPKEVLVPEESAFSLTSTCLQTRYSPISSDHAASRLCEFFGVKTLDGFGIGSASTTFPAAWSIIDYLKQTQKTLPKQLCSIHLLQTSQRMQMDYATSRNLELVQSLQDASLGHAPSLFDLLNHTKTAMGARLLKERIKSPFSMVSDIQKHQDALAVLFKDVLSREELREALKLVYDIERICSRLVSYTRNPKECLSLKQSLLAVSELFPTLSQLAGPFFEEKTQLFAQFQDKDSPYAILSAYIDAAISEDASPHLRDLGVIKEGFHEELDALRASFKDIRDWIQSLESVEREKTGIKSLKVGYNKVFGYYFEVTHSFKDSVPDHYIRKQTLTNAERYITPELKEKETILLTGEERQKQLEAQVFETVISYVKGFIPDLQHLATEISEIDVLQSLAHISHKNNYTQPVLTASKNKELSLKSSRHPILEKQTDTRFIPNDIQMSDQEDRLILITGPNMAGKSTIMRQVALIVVMAHMGCFVPAAEAKMSCVDRLFTRIGALDNLYQGQSTFMVEMVETASILHNATPNSLIILDEIGRGTSTYDGISIAASVIEHLHHTTQARTLFATHYHELTQLQETLPALGLYRMKITETDQSIVFNYEFEKGPANKSYGIHVAKMAGLPEAVLQRSTALLKSLETQSMSQSSLSAPNQLTLF